MSEEIRDKTTTEDSAGLGELLNSRPALRPEAIRAASIMGSVSCVDIAMNSWADVTQEDHQSFTALHHAARGGHSEVIEAFLRHRKEPLGTAMIPSGDATLASEPMASTGEGYEVTVVDQALPGSGCGEESGSVDLRTCDVRVSRLLNLCGGVTPLHLAAGAGEARVVQLLLRARADPEAADDNGWTAADHAKGKAAILALFSIAPQSALTQAEYDRATQKRNEDRAAALTPAKFGELLATADEGNPDALRRLLRSADVKSLRIGASSALAAATCLGSQDGLRVVLQALSMQGKPGHDPETAEKVPGLNQRDSMGFAPIHSAVETGFAQCLPPLLEAGADVHLRTVDASYKLGQTSTVYCEGGRTALHVAVQKGDVSCVEALLAGGASPHEKDSFGMTSCHHAVEGVALKLNRLEQRSEIAKLLGVDAAVATPSDLQLQRAERESVLRSRILQAARQAAEETRKNDVKSIRERYTPLDPVIAFDGLGEEAIGHDVVCWTAEKDGVAPFVRQCGVTGSRETGVESPFQGVFTFPLLSEDLCSRLWAETEHYHAKAAELDLPLPLRHDGCLDLSHVFPSMLDFISEAAMPAIRALLPSDLHDIKLQHAFRTKNFVGRDEDFKKHVDKYAVTLNVCLHKTEDVQGSGVFFFESQSAPEPSYRHEHSVGHAVLHSSKEWHQTEPLTAGERGSIIMWFNSCA